MLRGGLGDVVDMVVPVRVGQLLGGVVGDLGEDKGGERRGLGGGGGGALGEDGGVVCYAGANKINGSVVEVVWATYKSI